MIPAIKEYVLSILNIFGEYTIFIYTVLRLGIRRPPEWKLFREQFYHIGVCSLTVIAIAGFTTGFVLAAQSIYQLSDKGLEGVTGLLVGKSMVTELGPVLTAFMLTGRVGSAMCAELGSMRVTEQIDALRSMAIDPYYYLVVPRLFAGIFISPLLAIASMVMGVLGGYIIATTLFDMPGTTYMDPLRSQLSVFDVFTGLTKSIVFGIMCITICCFKGMKASGGAAGIGRSTTQSVVTSYILILVWDFLLTMGLNHIYKQLSWSSFG